MKRTFIGLAVILTSQMSLASIQVQDCVISAASKEDSGTSSQTLLLSPSFLNKLKILKTNLQIGLDQSGKIFGSVNDQPNFILKGNSQNGSFESAYDKGTIVCEKPQSVSHLYYNSGTGYVVSTDVNVGPSNGWKVLSSNALIDKKYCILGDVKAAADDLAKMPHVSSVRAGLESIFMDVVYTECLESYGMPGDGGCRPGKLVRKVKSVRVDSCSYSEDSRD